MGVVFFEENFVWVKEKLNSMFNRDMEWCCELNGDENRGELV